jgi:hypothetical protein
VSEDIFIEYANTIVNSKSRTTAVLGEHRNLIMLENMVIYPFNWDRGVPKCADSELLQIYKTGPEVTTKT